MELKIKLPVSLYAKYTTEVLMLLGNHSTSQYLLYEIQNNIAPTRSSCSLHCHIKDLGDFKEQQYKQKHCQCDDCEISFFA
uniref:Uncharacterized protein n=1 Tax=Arundo donax TaxID=35708 RepID=A0A0A9C6N4_ARUDO